MFMMNFFKHDKNLEIFFTLFSDPMKLRIAAGKKWSKYFYSKGGDLDDPRIKNTISKDDKLCRKATKFVKNHKLYTYYLRSFKAHNILNDSRNYRLIGNLN